MTEPSDDNDDAGLPMLGEHDPSRYQSRSSKVRFAVAKYYGMGPDGKWDVEDIANELDVHVRTVYRYINESEIGQDVQDVLATTEAEWRLDVALKLRKTVERLEEVEAELMQAKKSVPTGYETRSIRGTPTGDRNIRLPDDVTPHDIELPVPVDFEDVTNYSKALERVHKEKRQYLSQIADLLGLDAADRKEVDHNLASRHEEVKVVNVRQTDDPYPDVQPVNAEDVTAEDLQAAAQPVEVETVDDAEGSDDSGE